MKQEKTQMNEIQNAIFHLINNILSDDFFDAKLKNHKEQKIIDDATKVADVLKALEIKIASKVGSGDKLFGSVNNIDLAASLDKAGHAIDKKYINVTGGNVKRLGKYSANIRLHRDVEIDLPFEIIPEG